MIILKLFILLLMFFVANCSVKKTVEGKNKVDLSYNGTVQIIRFIIFIGLGMLIVIL